MKKIWRNSLLLVLLSVFLLAGCAGEPEPTPTPEPTPEVATTPAPEVTPEPTPGPTATPEGSESLPANEEQQIQFSELIAEND